MTKTQEALLQLFKEIHDICIENDIVYYLAGGTLIGAIRHGGFIPWDDDLDILMTRDNWHKLIKVLQQKIPENRSLECQELNRNYTNMFGRYCDLTKTTIHNNQLDGKSNCGFVIDILVLDPIPDLKESYQEYTEKLMLYSDLVNMGLNYSYRYGINQKEFSIYYDRIQKEGKDKVLSELEESMFFYKEKDCDYYAMRWGGAPFTFEKSMYGDSRWANFEGIKCRIPDRTSDYLVWHYGDTWMNIPPHGAQEAHDAIYNTDFPFKSIINDYSNYVDNEKLKQDLLTRKKYFLKNMKKRLAVKDRFGFILSTQAAINLENSYEKNSSVINNWINNYEFTKVKDFFADYCDIQFSRKCIGREDYSGIYEFNNPQYYEIDDSLLYKLIITLIHTTDIAKAKRLLDIRKQTNSNLTKELIKAEELIKAYRRVVSYYDLGQFEEALKLTTELYNEYPYNESIVMFYSKLLIEKKCFSLVLDVLESAIERFPNNGVIMKYLADCTVEDEPGKAYKLYVQAKENTTNGLILNELEYILKSDVFNDTNCEYDEIYSNSVDNYVDEEKNSEVEVYTINNLPQCKVMNNVHNKLIILLDEVNEICQKNNINWFLGPNTLALAMKHQGVGKDIVKLDIMMDCDNIHKFIIATNKENKSNRMLSYPGKTKNSSIFEVEYCDNNSIVCTVPELIKNINSGIKITITPIRTKVKKTKRLYASFLEKGLYLNEYKKMKKPVGKKQALAMMVIRAQIIMMGRRLTSKIIFSQLLKIYGSKGVSKQIINSNQLITFNKGQFERGNKITFENKEYPAPLALNVFMKKLFKNNQLKNKAIRSLSKKDNYIVMPNCTREILVSKFYNKYGEFRELEIDYRKFSKASRMNRKALEEKNKAKILAHRSNDRANIYMYLMENRYEIYECISCKNYKKLEFIFEEYNKLTNFYLKKNLGFCVSREFFEIQCKIYEEQGEFRKIQKLKKIIPQEHYTPII